MELWGRHLFYDVPSFTLICSDHRHKDYLFQKRLAKKLPMDSFRFDFRYTHTNLSSLLCPNNLLSGNHETPGPWNMSAFENDIEDLTAVASFLNKELGYTVTMVIGHSRGSIVAFKWVCTQPEARGIKYFVNCSGRYRMWVSTLIPFPSLTFIYKLPLQFSKRMRSKPSPPSPHPNHLARSSPQFN